MQPFIDCYKTLPAKFFAIVHIEIIESHSPNIRPILCTSSVAHFDNFVKLAVIQFRYFRQSIEAGAGDDIFTFPIVDLVEIEQPRLEIENVAPEGMADVLGHASESVLEVQRVLSCGALPRVGLEA